MPSVTKEAIKKEIDRVPNEKLEALYNHVKDLSQVKPKKHSRESFMAKMRKIRIDAPPDFSRNIDLYLSGKKTLE